LSRISLLTLLHQQPTDLPLCPCPKNGGLIQFRCSVCSEVLRDPVSIPCGHSYCRQCISTYWAQPGPAGDYVCLQCSKRSRDRPVLCTNTALARLLQGLQRRRGRCVFLSTVDVTLDHDTAHPYLILSEDGNQVRHRDIKNDLPDNPERFDAVPCVLGKEGFSSGRFYYEVQVKGKTRWILGVVKESINRKGKITLSPEDGNWTVWLKNGEYTANANPSVHLYLREKPQKVGVFVDYEKGQVSFYNVEARSHIYSFTGYTFTEKLYPYFCPGLNDGGKNSAPLVITPVDVTD
uniref:B30.2/SPRY domain-containing protein n=1 Tax=Oncorhynchus mykiss TaxID=8022 RepID=A0A8K9V5W2_ONCMY